MTRPVTITLTVTVPHMRDVREWLAEYCETRGPRDNRAALWEYVCSQLLSNSQWDGLEIELCRLPESDGGRRMTAALDDPTAGRRGAACKACWPICCGLGRVGATRPAKARPTHAPAARGGFLRAPIRARVRAPGGRLARPAVSRPRPNKKAPRRRGATQHFPLESDGECWAFRGCWQGNFRGRPCCADRAGLCALARDFRAERPEFRGFIWGQSGLFLPTHH